MKYLGLIIGTLIISTLVVSTTGFTSDVGMLLKDGKSAIEKGEYEKAVDCLGKILEISGDKSNDQEIVAFGSTVQAVGLIQMNNSQMNQIIRQYLQNAIDKDGEWEYPKKLLKKVNNQN